MYSASQYRTDLAHAWHPAQKSIAVFGKVFLKLDPFQSFFPCCVMMAGFTWFFIQTVFFTFRKLINH
jgi:hypothetical protein